MIRNTARGIHTSIIRNLNSPLHKHICTKRNFFHTKKPGQRHDNGNDYATSTCKESTERFCAIFSRKFSDLFIRDLFHWQRTSLKTARTSEEGRPDIFKIFVFLVSDLRSEPLRKQTQNLSENHLQPRTNRLRVF